MHKLPRIAGCNKFGFHPIITYNMPKFMVEETHKERQPTPASPVSHTACRAKHYFDTPGSRWVGPQLVLGRSVGFRLVVARSVVFRCRLTRPRSARPRSTRPRSTRPGLGRSVPFVYSIEGSRTCRTPGTCVKTTFKFFVCVNNCGSRDFLATPQVRFASEKKSIFVFCSDQ